MGRGTTVWWHSDSPGHKKPFLKLGVVGASLSIGPHLVAILRALALFRLLLQTSQLLLLFSRLRPVSLRLLEVVVWFKRHVDLSSDPIPVKSAPIAEACVPSALLGRMRQFLRPVDPTIT